MNDATQNVGHADFDLAPNAGSLWCPIRGRRPVYVVTSKHEREGYTEVRGRTMDGGFEGPEQTWAYWSDEQWAGLFAQAICGVDYDDELRDDSPPECGEFYISRISGQTFEVIDVRRKLRSPHCYVTLENPNTKRRQKFVYRSSRALWERVWVRAPAPATTPGRHFPYVAGILLGSAAALAVLAVVLVGWAAYNLILS